MNTLNKAALTFGAVASAVALTDAVWRATITTLPPWDESTIAAHSWAGAVTIGSHIIAYLLFATALLTYARTIPTHAVTLWTARLAAVNFVLLAILYALLSVAWNWKAPNSTIEAMFGVTFALIFLLPLIIGLTLLRRVQYRGPALLLSAPLIIVPLTGVLDAWTSWGHPGYAETAIYLGIPWLTIRAASHVLRTPSINPSPQRSHSRRAQDAALPTAE